MKYIKLFENWQEGDSLEYTQDTDSVTPEQAKDLITKTLAIKNEGEMVKSIMLVGAPGIGKEAVIKKSAKETGVESIMLDLSSMSPEDFMGVPRLSTREVPEEFETIPSWFPVDGSGIISLGSINRAERQIANAAISFAQSGRLGTNQLPEGWLIVATADGADDISTVISDRFTVLNLG
jgi:MoxR-like ATPase